MAVKISQHTDVSWAALGVRSRWRSLYSLYKAYEDEVMSTQMISQYGVFQPDHLKVILTKHKWLGLFPTSKVRLELIAEYNDWGTCETILKSVFRTKLQALTEVSAICQRIATQAGYPKPAVWVLNKLVEPEKLFYMDTQSYKEQIDERTYQRP